jgi:uncharacterized membrane protein (UPF0136 family)
MTSAKWAIWAFAWINIGLGLYGGLGPAKSSQSLYAGVGIGIVLFIALAMAMRMKVPRWGYILATLVTLAVLGRFAPIFMEEVKWVPAGILTFSGSAVLGVLVGGHFAQMKKNKAASRS